MSEKRVFIWCPLERKACARESCALWVKDEELCSHALTAMSLSVLVRIVDAYVSEALQPPKPPKKKPRKKEGEKLGEVS